jgi:hypothetical protein
LICLTLERQQRLLLLDREIEQVHLTSEPAGISLATYDLYLSRGSRGVLLADKPPQ